MTDKRSLALGTTDEPLESRGVGRSSGIPAIELMPWGTHFCEFFATRQDLIEIIAPFLRAGLEGNELCIWLTPPTLTVEDAAQALDREFGDVERRVAQGQLVITPAPDWYGTADFSCEQLLAPVLPAIEDAVAHGYAGLRTSGDLSWADDRYWATFMDYEEALSGRLAGQRIVGLCNYSLAVDASHLVDVMVRHKFALIRHEHWTLVEPSERRRATEAVERMNSALAERTEELQTALADLRGFTRWVTHDLRAPLRSARRFGDLLAETAMSKLDDDERHLLERIRVGTDRLDHLITDIMAYSTAQQKVLSPQLLDLGSAAREAWDTLTDVTGAGRVQLQLLPMPPAYGDRAVLTLALANLLGNAIKFTAGTTTPCVVVGARTVDEENVYYVQDNGIGFDPDCAEKVFGAFERLHSRAEYDGNGLGLAIVRQIIGRHGGRIWAETTPGAGATFSFTLPTPPGR